MRTFKIGITIEADNSEIGKKVGNLIQNAVNKVEQKDIIQHRENGKQSICSIIEMMLIL